MKIRILLLICFASHFTYAQVVDIPDDNFLEALIIRGLDFNGDGMIQVSEAEAAMDLNLSNSNISDLTGINAFVNIKELNVSDNQIIDLNFLNLPMLRNLSCSRNELINLVFENPISLVGLYCSENNINSIDLTKFYTLSHLNISSNLLTQLEVPGALELYDLNCSFNNLTELNVFHPGILETFICDNNNLSTLDLSNIGDMILLSCSNNQITSLDLGPFDNSKVQELNCSNNLLTELTIPRYLDVVDCSNNHLTYIEIFEGPNNNLELNCSNNKLSTLDLINKDLRSLNCSQNQLENLNLFGNDNLRELDASFNQLITINLFGSENILELNVGNNQLSNLDLTNNPSLEKILCNYNQITELNLSTDPNLFIDTFNCSFNELDELNLSNFDAFGDINCSNNKLTKLVFPNLDFINYSLNASHNLLTEIGIFQAKTLDLSFNAFHKFESNGNLGISSELILSNCPNLVYINIKDDFIIPFLNNDFCPSLVYICADFDEVSNFSDSSILINTLCDAGENGVNKTIEINTSFNSDILGCEQENEMIGNISIQIESAFNTIDLQTDNDGLLNYEGFPIHYTIKPINIDPSLYKFQPQEYVIDPNIPESFNDINFCFSPIPNIKISNSLDTNFDGCDENDNQFSFIQYQISSDQGSFTLDSDVNGQVSFEGDLISYTIIPIGLSQGEYIYSPNEIIVQPGTANYMDEVEFCITPNPTLNISSHIDINNNGCSFDEDGLSSIQYGIQSSNSDETLDSDSNGSLMIEALYDKYTITPINVDFNEFTIQPDEIEVDFTQPGFNNQVSFCLKPYPKVIISNKIDKDMDGCEFEENGLAYVKYLVDDGNNSSTIISDLNGHSTQFTVNKVYTIKPINIDDRLYSFTPEELIVDASDPGIQDSLFFCLTRKPEVSDLCIETFPQDLFRPGFETEYVLSFTNFGTDPKSGTVVFKFEDEFMDYIEATEEPVTQEEGLLTFAFEDLLPNENRRIRISLELNTPMDASPLEGGEELRSCTWIFPSDDDINRSNNFFLLIREVVNSQDPNDKTCLQGNELLEEYIGEYVHYKIRFENTGTADAINIVVRDTINLDNFDLSTLEVSDASHRMETRIVDPNIVEFVFADINLPFDDANNDGHITFRIKTLDDLELGDQISNSAGIFFDFNFPIITNTETSDFVEPTRIKSIKTKQLDLSISPNPVTEELRFTTEAGIKQLEVIDAQGRILLDQHSNSLTVRKLDVSQLVPGVYFLKIQNKDGLGIKAFVKY